MIFNKKDIMKRRITLRNYQKRVIIVVVSCFSLTLIILLIFGFYNSNKNYDAYNSYIIEENKNRIKVEIDNRYDEIQNGINDITENKKLDIKSRIDNLYTIYSSIKLDSMTEIEKNQYIIDNITSIEDKDTDTFYCILDQDGNLIYSSDDFAKEDKKIVSAVISNNNLNNILLSIDTNDGIYSTCFDEVREDNCVAYTKYLENFQCFIGLYFYQNNLYEASKVESINKMNHYYTSIDKYIFIMDSNGTILSHPKIEFINGNIEETYSINIEKINNNMNVSNGVFINYSAIDERIELGDKIGYVRKINEWDGYICMGFYQDDVITTSGADSPRFLYRDFFELFIIMGVLIAIFVYLYFGSKKYGVEEHKKNKSEKLIFTKLFEKYNSALVTITSDGILKYHNELASKIFDNNILYHFDSNGMLIDINLGSGIYKTIINKDSFIYIKVIMQKYYLDKKLAYVYSISDYTSEFLNEKELIEEANVDSLTGLFNRRELENDYLKWIKKTNNGEKIYLALLDLDKLKDVNDTYGHDFGDKIIIALANSFRDKQNEKTKFYRYGGEEFFISVEANSYKEAKNIILNLNDIFKKRSKDIIGRKVTFSTGLMLFKNTNISLEKTIEICDNLLYESKRNGRNRITSNN